MKVTSLNREQKVVLADLVEQIDHWKALQALAIQRQEDLKTRIAADTTCTIEELRINQGKLLEARWFIDQLREIHKEQTRKVVG